MLKLEVIKKSYNGRTVLDINTLTFKEGKIYAILGPNGSGKTTLLRIIAGVEKADCGEICYDGGSAFLRNDMAYMPQKPYMFDTTVLKNAAMGVKRSMKAKYSAGSEFSTQSEDCVIAALKGMGMQSFLDRNAPLLSGGESQRVAIARTISPGKRLLLLDEPTSTVDVSSVKLVESYIKEVNRNLKTTVLFSTHAPSQAAHIADEVIFIFDGCIIEKRCCNDFFDSPGSIETKDFLANWRV